MSTSHAGGGAPGVLDRLTDWVLDHDGDIYGQDERERYRWYEGIALAASAQWIVVPWTLAALIWFADRNAAILLAIVAGAFYLTMIPATVHVSRKRVETRLVRWTRKRIVLTLLTFPAGPVFVLGCVYAFGNPDAFDLTAALIGGLIGAGVGAAILTARTRARRRQLAAEAGAEQD